VWRRESQLENRGWNVFQASARGLQENTPARPENLYLPSDLPQERAFYLFLMGDTSKIGGAAYETDLTQIHPVIESFVTK
jgi:hypothetical protein